MQQIDPLYAIVSKIAIYDMRNSGLKIMPSAMYNS
jgi:hypothetical protein